MVQIKLSIICILTAAAVAPVIALPLPNGPGLDKSSRKAVAHKPPIAPQAVIAPPLPNGSHHKSTAVAHTSKPPTGGATKNVQVAQVGTKKTGKRTHQEVESSDASSSDSETHDPKRRKILSHSSSGHSDSESEHSGSDSEHSGSNSEHSGSNSEHSGSNSEHSGSNSEHSGSNSEHSGSNSEHSGSNSEHSGSEPKWYNPSPGSRSLDPNISNRRTELSELSPSHWAAGNSKEERTELWVAGIRTRNFKT